MTKLAGWKLACLASLLCAATAIAAPAQGFTTLFNFDLENGANPSMSLIQGADGNFYGTTDLGGASNNGSVFKITPAGTLKTLYSFCRQTNCTDGALPWSALIQATNGKFYGTTYQGGADGAGTVFQMTLAGKLIPALYSFCSQPGCTDGAFPYVALVEGTDGNFYGTTYHGGAKNDGTIFKITPAGTLSTLYSFCAQNNCADGTNPLAALVESPDGYFYGTTHYGGATGDGTVFEITPEGALTTLYSFCAQSNCTDGTNPTGALVQGTNGNFYGTTYEGGDHGDGTVFEITPQGALTTLYSFCSQANCIDGANPYAGLVQATDGNIYGTTLYGGTNCLGGCGTIFKITPGGTLTTLYSFCSQANCTDGFTPYGGLMQATGGDFYGTTYYGGANSDGSVFSLATGLGPFVKTLPTAGEVGVEVGILGTALTGATSVTFNGTQAKFSVQSPSLILTHVPAGATTGTVNVTLPSQTLSSNVPFYVLP